MRRRTTDPRQVAEDSTGSLGGIPKWMAAVHDELDRLDENQFALAVRVLDFGVPVFAELDSTEEKWREETCGTCGWSIFLLEKEDVYGGCRGDKPETMQTISDCHPHGKSFAWWPIIKRTTLACPAWVGRK